ncbi:dehydroascorbate reductase 2 [Tanacetum coccineum]
MCSSTKEAAEAIMICLDNSYWMESTKSPMFKEQADAIENYCNIKLKSHSLVGLCAMAEAAPHFLIFPTQDIEIIMAAVNGIPIGGRLRFEHAVSNAHNGLLADLYEPMQKRIVFFVGCSLYFLMDHVREIGRIFKDLNLACDVITFGDPYYQKSKLFECLIESANNKGNCNICVVPPESSISEALCSSQIIIPPPAGGGISSPPPSSISAAIDIYVKAPSDRADVNTDCPFCQRVLLTLREKKLVYNTTFIYLENKPEWFAETWTLPLIRFDDGTWASNSDIIVEMIEKKRPDIPLVTPQHFAYLGLKILPKLMAYLKNNNNDTRQDLLFELMELEKHLSDNEGPYVNGKDVTAVDLSLAPKLYHLVEACEHFYGWNILKKFPKVLDYNKVHPHAFFNS